MEENENIREQSGGLMIARTYAELVSALSDEEAGRTLKGLIYEFWGCGENAAVSENPLVNALFNSIVQTAREIDNNYQAQRIQKREAGRKSAELRKQKSTSVPTALSGAEECSNGVQLNKSKENKSNENKIKENKSNESKVSESKETAPPAAAPTPPAAALTAKQKNILIEKYGQSAVEAYQERYDRWRSSKAHCNANAYSCISKWLDEDKPENKPENTGSSFSSFNAENIEQIIMERYKNLV